MAEVPWWFLVGMSGFAGVGVGEMLRHVVDWFLLRRYSKKVTSVLHEVVGDVEAQAEFRRKND